MCQSANKALAQQNSALSALVLAQQRELEALRGCLYADVGYRCDILTYGEESSCVCINLYVTCSVTTYADTFDYPRATWRLYVHEPRIPYVAIKLDEDRILLAQRQQRGQLRERTCEMFGYAESAPMHGELRFQRRRGPHQCAKPSDCEHAFQIVRQHGQSTRLSRRALTCVLQELFRFCARVNSNACKEISAIAKHFEIILE